MEENKQKKEKSKLRKAFDWVIVAIFGVLFLLIGTYEVVGLSTKKENYGVPNFFGTQTLIVLTDSMEPDYKVGGAVIVKKVKPSEIKRDDDITFFYEPWKKYMSNPIVTHRVIDIIIDETREEGFGRYTFITHGINTDSDNCNATGTSRDCTGQTQEFYESAVLGKVVYYSKTIGFFYKFLSSWYGLLVVLLIPSLYLMITSVLDIFKAVKEPDEEEKSVVAEIDLTKDETPSKKDVLNELSEEDKKRLKEELLNEILNKGADK